MSYNIKEANVRKSGFCTVRNSLNFYPIINIFSVSVNAVTIKGVFFLNISIIVLEDSLLKGATGGNALGTLERVFLLPVTKELTPFFV